MAFIGMRHPVVATVATEVKGQELTYNPGMVVGHAIMANLTINRNSNPLYGDDVIVEEDNGITSMTMEFGADDIAEEVRVYTLGLTQVDTMDEDENQLTYWEEGGNASPYVGFGYIRVRRLNGATTFQGVWCHKAIFGQTSENSQTKGETIEWQTPTLSGRVMGVYNDASGIPHFRRTANFTTEAAAIAWLNKLANITA